MNNNNGGVEYLRVLGGDAVGRLKELESGSVQCCVTSPPYWGLRDYGTAKWEGGEEGCKHEPPQEWIDHNFNAKSAFGTGAATQSAAAKSRWFKSDGSCRCGARRIDSQLGLEKTPEEYVGKMVAVFREMRRVLKDDGTLWLNLGDSYNSSPAGENPGGFQGAQMVANAAYDKAQPRAKIKGKAMGDCKPKDLVGIPWMVAFALRADGWYRRSDIIWAKPNPMPESVTDRPTKAHEYIFLLTKSARYFYDADSIAEPVARTWDEFNGGSLSPNGLHKANGSMRERGGEYSVCTGIRNKRSVWTVNSAPYPEAHFATYPPDLIKPCVLAGSRAGDTILDPFAGSGTTGQVALELGRRAILIELNPKYIELIEARCNTTIGFCL